MLGPINCLKNARKSPNDPSALALLAADAVRQVRAFHCSIPAYAQTPLVKLDGLADRWGLKALFVKDESERFGLKAFKVLGGSYAIAKIMAERLGLGLDELSYDELRSTEAKAALGDLAFYTATDGNHGRGVAWAARQLNQAAVVGMPAGSSAYRLAAIQNEGAKAWVTDLNYDDTVRFMKGLADADPQGVLVQDTAWPGYEEIPGYIMQGYSTLVAEAIEGMAAAGSGRPTHVFVQAGVGSLAGAVQGYLTQVFGADCPVVCVIESAAADCLYRSIQNGRLTAVGGSLDTVMAGLACGEASTLAWQILEAKTDFFVSAPDWLSGKGMRVLGAPLGR
ncbi:MAG: diaminopropionate ammonia-lyase, partial [Coriobacteriia bacterium]|nr:diaminopropionate ammonia-lyase [Coriobacteriia bacterium]